MAEDSLLLAGDGSAGGDDSPHAGEPTATRIDRAVEDLEGALEEIDLRRDPALADAVVAALAAADRARRLGTR